MPRGVHFSDSDPWRKAAKLLKRSVGPHFEPIVSAGASICWLALVMRDQGFALGVLDQSRGLPDRQWLTRQEFDQALSKILERFRSMNIISIFDATEPLQILFCWQMFGDSNELKTATDMAARDDATFVKALQAMRTWVVSSAKGMYSSLEERNVASFMDAKAAKQRLGISRSDECASKELRQSADELLGAWVDNIPY